MRGTVPEGPTAGSALLATRLHGEVIGWVRRVADGVHPTRPGTRVHGLVREPEGGEAGTGDAFGATATSAARGFIAP